MAGRRCKANQPTLWRLFLNSKMARLSSAKLTKQQTWNQKNKTDQRATRLTHIDEKMSLQDITFVCCFCALERVCRLFLALLRKSEVTWLVWVVWSCSIWVLPLPALTGCKIVAILWVRFYFVCLQRIPLQNVGLRAAKTHLATKETQKHVPTRGVRFKSAIIEQWLGQNTSHANCRSGEFETPAVSRSAPSTLVVCEFSATKAKTLSASSEVESIKV